MRIAVDANIPEAEAYFSPWGEIHPFDGRHLSNADLKNIDVLMVRSVTKVNRELLEGTPIQFVGTATAGINHIDGNWLDEQGIPWFSAPGSNSWSVADYVCSLCAKLLKDQKISLGAIIGVIGHGHVGSKVAHRLRLLGFNTRIYDPLHPEIENHPEWGNFNHILDAEVITFHVPLTKNGSHPTLNWVNKDLLSQFSQSIHLINTCRGEIFNESDILQFKSRGKIQAIYSDVFWNEPRVNLEYLKACDLYTPHIAGYSWTGKIRGTLMLAEALGSVFGQATNFPHIQKHNEAFLSCLNQDLYTILLNIYNPWVDQQRWIEATDLILDFDRQRKSYPQRFEYSDWTLTDVDPKWHTILSQLGFTLQ